MVCLSVPREVRWGRGSAVALWLILSLCLCLPSLTPSRDSSLANSLTEHTRQRGEEAACGDTALSTPYQLTIFMMWHCIVVLKAGGPPQSSLHPPVPLLSVRLLITEGGLVGL